MEVSYGPHTLQTYKVFHHLPENKKTLLLIHGGAWNDPNNTFNDFKELAGNLVGEQNLTTYNIIGINYRLTPEVVHPVHLMDIATGIKSIFETYAPTQISLAGHSVGATMVLQLLNLQQIMTNGLKELDTGSHSDGIEVLCPEIQFYSLFLIDGIYDIKDLISEYGQPYKKFVDRAFVSEVQYTEAVQTSSAGFTGFERIFDNIVVFQSKEDELLSLRQTDGFLAFLRELGVKYNYYEEDWGKHEEVYRRSELAAAIAKELGN